MFELFDILLSAGIALLIAVTTLVTLRAVKKNYTKTRTHIIRGWTKKKRRIMPANNDDILQANWKVEFWSVLCVMSLIMPLGLLIFSAIDPMNGEVLFPIAILLLLISAPVGVFSAIMFLRRRKEFYELAAALCAEFVQDEETVKEVSEKLVQDTFDMKVFGIPYAFTFGFLLVALSIFSVTNFMNGNFVMAIVFALAAVINIPSLVKAVKSYAAKRRKK